MTRFEVGDSVWYVLDGIGQRPPIWAAAVVVQVTPRRVGVRAAVGTLRARYVAPERLATGLPPPDVVTLRFPPWIRRALFAGKGRRLKWVRIGPALRYAELLELHDAGNGPDRPELHAAAEPRGGGSQYGGKDLGDRSPPARAFSRKRGRSGP